MGTFQFIPMNQRHVLPRRAGFRKAYIFKPALTLHPKPLQVSAEPISSCESLLSAGQRIKVRCTQVKEPVLGRPERTLSSRQTAAEVARSD